MAWYRCYPGGVYCPLGTFNGLIIAGYTGDCSYMDAEILVTSLNGEASAAEKSQR